MTKVVRNRSLLLIGAAESLTDLGNWITVLACFALVVFHGGGDAGESGGILLALLLPALPISPLAGWLSDRFDRRSLMIASKLLAALATVGLLLADRLELIYAALAVQTAFSALVVPPRQASIFQIADRADLSRANAFLQQLSSIVKIAGPLLGGALLAVLTPQQAFAADLACLLLAALLLTRLPALPPYAVVPAAPNHSGGATGGRWLRRVFRDSAALRWLFVVLLLDSAVVATFDVLGAVFTRDALHGDETLYGTLISLVGAGAVASTLFLLLAKRPAKLWRDVVLGVLLFGAMPVSFMLAASGLGASAGLLAPLLLSVGALLGGIANGLFGVQTSTLLQLLAPVGTLGRMEGFFQGIAVVGQLAAFLLTPLLVPAVISMGGIFAADAAALALLALALALVVRRFGRGHAAHEVAAKAEPAIAGLEEVGG